jgi:epoxyqueuosine reductase
LKPETLKQALIKRAEAQGFVVTRVTSARLPATIAHDLADFIAHDYHGAMDWMAETQERRQSPDHLWPEARSAIVLGMSYAPDASPLAALQQRDQGYVSVYARSRDYHDEIKGKLKQVAAVLAQAKAQVKVFVDTAPLMEKPLAQQAGLGWQGKHTVLVNRQQGNWLLLGVILTDAELPPDLSETDHCGSCRRCLTVCPTDAFPAPYKLDARRCITYLTVEHKGPIPVEFRKPIGNRIFGCDDCLAVCPWNKFAQDGQAYRRQVRDDLAHLSLHELLQLDDAGFRAFFAATPIKRTGFARFMRNVLIGAGNSGDRSLVPPVRALLNHAEPLIRGAAIWSLASLMEQAEWQALRDASLPLEGDAEVMAEWQMYWQQSGGHQS